MLQLGSDFPLKSNYDTVRVDLIAEFGRPHKWTTPNSLSTISLLAKCVIYEQPLNTVECQNPNVRKPNKAEIRTKWTRIPRHLDIRAIRFEIFKLS